MVPKSSSSSNPRRIPWSEPKQLSLAVSKHNCGIRYLEHVQVQVDLSFPRRGYLEMSSLSPSGTRSRLLYPRVIDSITGFKNFTNLKVTSLHYWGENPVGEWNIIIRNTRKERKRRQGKMCYITCKRNWTFKFRTFHFRGVTFQRQISINHIVVISVRE